MPEPLSDETLAEYAGNADYFDRWYGVGNGVPIRNLLAEVARLKTLLAALESHRP